MPNDVKTALTEVNQKFMEMFASGDSLGIAGLYTPDGQLLPPNGDLVTGQEAVAGFWQFVMGLGIKTVRLESTELEVHGDVAVEIGQYTLGAGEGKTVDRGKYLVFWKNDTGGWKLHRDIWNTSMPAPGQE
ncbi:YybH family protein [Gemmatimonadota bacterium]